MTKERIVVAMSGGVDSSVAAALLVDEGFDVVGLFMRNGVKPSEAAKRGKQGCCSLDDSMDARRVASLLDVPFFAVNFERDFGDIIDYFVAEYDQGRTPNPCIRCNRDLKFGRLLDYADEIGASAVATGHYARLVRRGDRRAVARGRDRDKDQSYVLFPLDQTQLARTLLPLGELTKAQVRAKAAEIGLPVADKPESQEICFVPTGNYADVLRARDPESLKPGSIVDETGAKLGDHEGHQLYTIGQRRGLGIAAAHPLYVVRTEPDTNTVVVGPAESVKASGLEIDAVTWSGTAPIEAGEIVTGSIQVRSHHLSIPATATGQDDGRVRITFDEPITAVTPGQGAVFYKNDTVLFGGFLDRALDAATVRGIGMSEVAMAGGLATVVLIVLAVLRFRSSSRKVGRIATMILIAASIVGFFLPETWRPGSAVGTRDAIVVLVDVSASLGPRPERLVTPAVWRLDDREDARDIEDIDIAPTADTHIVVVAFARHARVLFDGRFADLPDRLSLPADLTTSFGRSATDIGDTFRLAGERLAPDEDAALVVVTDGGLDPTVALETTGGSLPFPRRSVVVRTPDVIPLEDVRVRFVSPPPVVTAGATVSIEVEVAGDVGTRRNFILRLATRGASATIDDADRVVRLDPGRPSTRFMFHVANVPFDLTAVEARLVDHEGWDAAPDDVATLPVIVKRDRPRLGIVSDNATAAADLSRRLASVSTNATANTRVGLDVRVIGVEAFLSGAAFRDGAIDVFIVTNVGLDDRSDARRGLPNVVRSVARGTGLLLAGARRSFGRGGWADTDLDELSPLRSRPGRRPRLISVALDRSGSMEASGRFAAARSAVLGLYRALDPEDRLRLVAFGVDVEERSFERRDGEAALRDFIGRLRPEGGTRLDPMLEAVTQLPPDDRDGIVLVLSDFRDRTSWTPVRARRWRDRARASRQVVHAFWFDRDPAARLALETLTEGGAVHAVDDFDDLVRPFLSATRRDFVRNDVDVVRSDGGRGRVATVLRTRVDDGAAVLAAADDDTPVLATVRRGVGKVAAAPVDLDVASVTAVWGDDVAFARFVHDLAPTGLDADIEVAVENVASGVRYRVTGLPGVDGGRLDTADGAVSLRRVGPTRSVSAIMSHGVRDDIVVVRDAAGRFVARRPVVAPRTDDRRHVASAARRAALSRRLWRAPAPLPTAFAAAVWWLVMLVSFEVLFRLLRR